MGSFGHIRAETASGRGATWLPAPLLALFVCVWSATAGAVEFIPLQDWEKVTSAVSVLQLPPLQRVVGKYESGKDMRIVIRYPGGDAGNQWAMELRDWLVSFGISVEDIELEPGSGRPHAIAIDAEPRSAW